MKGCILAFVLTFLWVTVSKADGCSYTDMRVNPSDCNKYIKCVNGTAVESMCEPGLVFNVIEQKCDEKKNVPHCGIPYVFELRIVTDFKLFTNYQKLYGYGSQAKNILEGDIKIFMHQVNEYMKTLQPLGLNIEVRLKQLDILTTDILFQDKKLFTESTGHLLTKRGLGRFYKWWKADTDASNQTYDQTILWTGHKLYYTDWKKLINGYSFDRGVCIHGYYGFGGIMQADATQATSWKFLYIVANSLGVSITTRPKTSDCVPYDITTTQGYNPNLKSRWHFSRCSARQIVDLLNSLDKYGKNCLKETTTKQETFNVTKAYGSDIFDAQKVCQRAVSYRQEFLCKPQTSFKFIATSQDPLDSDSACQTLFCPNGPQSYIRAVPTEGMKCAKGKRCMQGKCLPSDN